MKSMFNCTHCSYSSNYKSNVIRHSNVKHQVRDGTDKLHKTKKKPCLPKLSMKIEEPFQFYTEQPKEIKDYVHQNKITEELIFSSLLKFWKNQMFLSIPLKTYLSKRTHEKKLSNAKEHMNRNNED